MPLIDGASVQGDAWRVGVFGTASGTAATGADRAAELPMGEHGLESGGGEAVHSKPSLKFHDAETHIHFPET